MSRAFAGGTVQTRNAGKRQAPGLLKNFYSFGKTGKDMKESVKVHSGEVFSQILVSGHRNPDVDSIASAVALAELRRRQGAGNITAVCPGLLPERAAWLLKRFNTAPPPRWSDVSLRVRDVTETAEILSGGTTLFDAVRQLGVSGFSRLPVADESGRYLGMLSPMTLLSRLLHLDSEGSLAGRRIYSSIELIGKILEAEILSGVRKEKTQHFQVYVAAMSLDSFASHIPENCSDELALIVGDRPDIHLQALRRKIRLLIVTGDREVDPLVREAAQGCGVSVLQTKLDSATVIRRLKFSVPLEHLNLEKQQGIVLSPDDRLRDVRGDILNSPEDVIPVTDASGKISGVVRKKVFTGEPPRKMILVDHNELEQSLPGVEELPVIEVVDHHRIGMMPTASPIKFTGDTVGSTCTLVASMFRAAGESLSPELAGILLGGIVTDTLFLKSPTTADLDRRMAEWLEKVSGVQGAELMAGLLQIESPLATKDAAGVLSADRKDYTDGPVHFALSQIEESNLELLHQRFGELSAELDRVIAEDKLDFAGLLVTDAVRENSELLIRGSKLLIQKLPYARRRDGLFSLPGVLSRKKQLLPQILALTAGLRIP